MLNAQILGPLAARSDGKPLKLGGTKQRALLASLILAEGRPVSIARLQDAMWGDSDRDHNHALQAHVSRLRSILPVPIAHGAAGYRIAASQLRLDAAEFNDHFAAGREHINQNRPDQALISLDRALALWRGPALSDLAHITVLQPALVRLEELRQRAETDRVDAKLALGHASDVIPHLQARLEELPLEERTWHQLISALQQADRLAEALATYHVARDTFIDRLGTEPGPGLVALHQRLLATSEPTSVTAPWLGDSAEEVAHRLSRPLAGRERELANLRQACTRAADGLHLVTILGEPGIGKTRLAAELAAEHSASGRRVLFGRCDEFMAVPYQPFVEMIRAAVGHLSGPALAQHLGPYPADLARIMPELIERLPPTVAQPLRSDPPTELYRTFDAVAGWLADISRTAPVTLVLDDLQWADRPTVLLVRHLTHSLRRIPAVMLATLRDREQRQFADSHVLLASLMRQSETVTPLPLTGMDEDGVAALLRSESGSGPLPQPSGPALISWVSAASGGNPLYVIELAHSVSETRTEPTDPFSGSLPAGLRELINSRLRRLPDNVRTLLQVASAMGADFGVATLTLAVDMTPDDVDGALATAEFARLIRSSDGTGLAWSFSHDVVRSALYDAMAPLQRGAVHLRIAVAMESLVTLPALSAQSQATQLAHHYTRALPAKPEIVGRAIAYLRRAGDHAMEQRAPAVAVDHYRVAVSLLPAQASAQERCDLMTGLGTALFRSGDAGYREVLLEVGRLAMRAGDQQRLAAAAIANNRGWWSSTVAIDLERIALIEAALRGCDEDDIGLRSQLLASWALENVRDPAQRTETIRASAAALDLAEESGDEELLAFALSHRFAVTHATFSDPQGCVDLNQRIFDLSRRRADPGLRLTATIGLAQSTAVLGEFTISDHALSQALELSETLHEPARLWLTRTWHAMRLATRGEIGKAEAAATAAYELGVETGQPDAFTWFAGQLFTFRMLEGRVPEIIAEIEEQASSHASGIPSWRAAYALALTSVDRTEEAAEVLAEFVAGDFAQLPVDMLWLHGMAYLCLACEALEDAEAARALYAALLPHSGLIAHNGTIDAGPVDLHLGSMARLFGAHQIADEHLADAEKTCVKINAPLWLERVRTAHSGAQRPDTRCG